MDIEREESLSKHRYFNFLDSDGQSYQLNFIDTPVHVDFSYEVSRSLAAVRALCLS